MKNAPINRVLPQDSTGLTVTPRIVMHPDTGDSGVPGRCPHFKGTELTLESMAAGYSIPVGRFKQPQCRLVTRHGVGWQS